MFPVIGVTAVMQSAMQGKKKKNPLMDRILGLKQQSDFHAGQVGLNTRTSGDVGAYQNLFKKLKGTP